MAVDPRKRQKKLERKKAKQKAERRDLARREPQGMALRLASAARYPVLHCCMVSELWEKGIGNVLISRQLPRGEVAFVAFLVDVYCLGVKDVILQVAPRASYQEKMYDRLADRYELTSLKPECARKLVEGAVQYALDLGLSPHPDYRVAKAIFGDVSPEACRESYTYGKDGKPFFFAGPYDDHARCTYILRSLHEHCGPDGYHYVLPLQGPLEIPE